MIYKKQFLLCVECFKSVTYDVTLLPHTVPAFIHSKGLEQSCVCDHLIRSDLAVTEWVCCR